VEAGFDMLDVGAVAARSGPPVGVEDECAALVPAIAGLATLEIGADDGEDGEAGGRVPISADTFQVETARRALEAGAVCVNDISGGCDEMFELVVSFSMFEHLHEYEKGLAEVARVIRPGGLFLLGMPAVNKLMEAAFLAIGFKGINDHHVTTPRQVARAFTAAGLSRVGFAAIDLPFRAPLGLRVYHAWLLEKRAARAAP